MISFISISADFRKTAPLTDNILIASLQVWRTIWRKHIRNIRQTPYMRSGIYFPKFQSRQTDSLFSSWMNGMPYFIFHLLLKRKKQSIYFFSKLCWKIRTIQHWHTLPVSCRFPNIPVALSWTCLWNLKWLQWKLSANILALQTKRWMFCMKSTHIYAKNFRYHATVCRTGMMDISLLQENACITQDP